MVSKMIEIRDSGTCIPALAMQMASEDATEHRFFHRCGYPADGTSIMLMRLMDGKATNDPYEWSALGLGLRTMQKAHDYIIRNFADLKAGQVVDVRVLLGETQTPKRPEIGA